MKLSVNRVNEYIEQFVKGVMLPSATSLVTKFKLGFALGSGSLALDDAKLAALRSLGIADAEGVDVEKLKRAAYSGIDASGSLAVPGLDVTLDRPDFDRFFHLLETGSVN